RQPLMMLSAAEKLEAFKKADCCSAGIVALTLLTAHHCFSIPRTTDPDNFAFEYLRTHDYPRFWQHIVDVTSRYGRSFRISDSTKDLLVKMLTPNLQERITVAQALEHPCLAVDSLPTPGEVSEVMGHRVQ